MPESPEPIPNVELFLDDRGSLLRVRWDDVRHELVVSLWRDGVCVATHRLDQPDTARLATLTTRAMVDSLRHALEGSA